MPNTGHPIEVPAGVSMVLNDDALVSGLTGLVVHALDGAAARLTDEDRPETAADEARDRDLIWGAATMTGMLGEAAPSALRLWCVDHVAIIEAVRLSVEAADETEGSTPHVRVHEVEPPSSIDGEALVEALVPFLDPSRYAEGEDGSIIITVKPWEVEALHDATAPAFDYDAACAAAALNVDVPARGSEQIAEAGISAAPALGDEDD